MLREYAKLSLALVAVALVPSGPTHRGRPSTSSRQHAAFARTTGTQHDAGSTPLPAPREPLTRELSAGEIHSYQISLYPGQYLRVTAEQHGADARVTLYEPGGPVLVESDCRRREPTPVSVIAETQGAYRLDVRLLDKDDARGRYTLKVGEARRATPGDRYRVDAEKIFDEAERLLKRWEAESSRAAVDKFKGALSSWGEAGDRREQAHTLKRIGDVYQTLGEPQNALGFYNQSLALSRAARDRPGEGETLNEIAYVHLTLGENLRASELCTRALKLGRATGDRRVEAQALNNLGEVRYGLGKLQQSLEFYQSALPLWRELGDRQGQAQTTLNFGYTYSDLGKTGEAFNSYNEALSLWRAARDVRGQAVTLSAVGRLYSRVGESQEALGFFERAMSLARSVGDPIEEGRILNGIAYVYDQLGEKLKAIEYYDRALPLFQAAAYSNGEASTLYDAGRVHHSLGGNDRALEHYDRGLAISEAGGDRRLASFLRREIGRVYDSRGEQSKALEYYLVALLYWREEEDFRAEADTLNPLGRIYEARGERRRALEHYERALLLSRKADYPYGEAAALSNVARVERDGGDLAEALKRIEAAAGVVESLRAKVDSHELRASYFASVRQHYEFYIDLLMELHARRPAEGFAAAAFEASERARARSLLETLAAARVGVRRKADPALLERARSLRSELSDRTGRQARPRGGPPDAEATHLAGEIETLTRQLREVEARIRVSSLEHTSLIQPQPLGLKAIQEQVIDDDALLLEYSLGEARSYLWAVTKTEIETHELPGRAEIEGAANRLRELLVAPQPIEGESFAERQARIKLAEGPYREEAAALSGVLLGPVAARLGERRLLIVADGALQYIPFSALPSPGPAHDGGEPTPLVLRHEITHQPSASALASLRGETLRREPAAKAVAIFADPVFEEDDARLKTADAQASAAAREQALAPEPRGALRDAGLAPDERRIPRLPASRDEAEAIMASAPGGDGLKATGFDASKAAATSPDLGHYRVIHFATHGILDSERPEQSGLVLSLFDERGRPLDGFLRLNDIYNLDLPADIVVLSACNTGLGKDVRGEGLVGLTRGFMHAGAARVMASLWKVDDEATAELMKHFYRQLLEEKKSPAAALRQAQIAMIGQKRWRAPYFWAAFELQGEYGGKIDLSRNARRNRPAVLIVALAFILTLSGLYAARRMARRNIS